ncbi:MAG: SWIM zinc finger family protein [Saprospiraceae bacterium]|nr:SWIM zinc finger family protein [Saprospiraceae bacterium]
MNHFSKQQVEQLAPDASSLKAGKDLANLAKWVTLGISDRALWGEVQGSGKNPYQTQVDGNSTAFKCSCPSRKFPCKHGLGLLFLFAENAANLKQTNEPAWVKDWIDKRQEKAEKTPASVSEEKNDETDEKKAKQKAKTQDDRLANAQAGAAELELWLKDLLRNGFLSIPEKAPAFFQKTAARMVDAKATGLGNFVKGFNRINYYNGTTWQSEVLEQAAKTFLTLEGFKNLEKLSTPISDDIRSLVGWSAKQKELLEDENAEALTDEWLTLARLTEREDDLTIQRHYLLGLESHRLAMILDFAYKNTAMPTLLMPATATKATLVFQPSNALLRRAFIKNQGANTSKITTAFKPLANWTTAQHDIVQHLQKFLWADDIVQVVADLSLASDGMAWFLKDTEGSILKLNPQFSEEKIWQLLAVSGGVAKTFAMLRTKETVLPLGIFEENTYQIL